MCGLFTEHQTTLHCTLIRNHICLKLLLHIYNFLFFNVGTDEHGTKIQQAAAKAKMSPLEYCNNISNEYRGLFKEFDVEYTDFIRTTEERHKTAVKHFWVRF